MREAVQIIVITVSCLRSGSLYNNPLFRRLIMKVMLDVFALCETVSSVVGSLEKFLKDRERGNFTSTKKKNIVDGIMARPKKCFNLTLEMLLNLSEMKKSDLRRRISAAVETLTKSQKKNTSQVTVFEVDDERTLRGTNIKHFQILRL